MLTDHWVIAQLLSQLCALVLLAGATRYSVSMLRHWNADSSGAVQLSLERKTWLVSSIVQFVLAFQVLALLMFLVTVNQHLPNLIKGAMCATGVLELNPWGYPLLFLKILSVFVYGSYLITNHLDNKEPGYPLTPGKYWLLFPSLLLAGADFVLMWLFFSGIEPDIIATCCSISFIGVKQSGLYGVGTSSGSSVYFYLFFVFFALLTGSLVLLKKRPLLQLLAAMAFVGVAVLALKTFFVKYIYGLPSHLCLFDIFFGQYHYIGYAIFGAFYALLFSLLVKTLYHSTRKKLETSHSRLSTRTNRVALMAALAAFAIPVAYWLAWNGTL